jgi:TPR repeat protein
MSTADDDDDDIKCAACGEGGDDLKACTACKLVKYCNASCQRAHRPQHKKECRKRAAELHDEALFNEPLPREECPICLLTLPITAEEQKYQTCCGTMLCSGCIYAANTADTRKLCPFCRTPEATSEAEAIERLKKRVEADDANAMRNLGNLYSHGEMGLPQDYNKAMELWLRAGELGDAVSYNNIGYAYYFGQGVERDMKKAIYYYELAAMGGNAVSRNNLGGVEADAGNMDRAMKHFMISAGAGDDKSLEKIRVCFIRGDATKDDFEKALRANKESKDEMKSDQREAAAVFRGLR